MSDDSGRRDDSTRSAAAWRAQALVEVQDLRTQLIWMKEASCAPGAVALAEAVELQLERAESVIISRGSALSLLTGSHMQAAREYIDAATVNLLRLAPAGHLRSLLPNLLVEARSHLSSTDPRLQVLAEIHKESSENLAEAERFAVVAAVQGSQLEAHREQMRVRSFRNIILGVSAVIAAVAFIVAIVGWTLPNTFPLCFAPSGPSVIIVCPLAESAPFSTEPGVLPSYAIPEVVRDTVSPLDVAVVEFLGALGATIAAASGLRTMRASADPFSLGVALALLKLPTGAMTAFLGVLLIRAGLIPGLTALDTSAQIIAWAIILGYSQQLFTRFVDQQAQHVLQEADSIGRPRVREG